jgi:NADPH oxidase
MTYVTQKMKDDDLTNIMVSDVGGENDTISGLRAPTHYGRPNWDQIFSGIKDRHPDTEWVYISFLR